MSFPDYHSLSVIPDHSVNMTTGEAHSLIRQQRQTGTHTPSSSYNDQVIYTARQVSWAYWEKIASDLLKNMLDTKNKIFDNFDAILKDGNVCEIKTGRIWNGSVIIKDQLEKIPSWWYYILVFYKIHGFENPSEALKYAHDNLTISPEIYLKRNLQAKKIFIFPKSDIVWFYNSHPKVSRKITNKKGNNRVFEYVLMKLRSTQKLWDENPGNHEQFHFSFHFQKKESIEVFVNRLDLKL